MVLVVVLVVLQQAQNSNYGGAVGGVGVQLPSTFHDPNQQIGAYKAPNTTWYWVCGGGGGGAIVIFS